MGVNAIEVSDDTRTPNTPTMNLKPDSPQTPSNIKTRRKLLRAESLEDLHVLAIKKKPSMKKKKKAPTAATKTTINEEMTTASGDRQDSTDGAAAATGATGATAVTGVKKSPKKIKKKVLKKSLTSEIITMSSPFTDSTTPEQIRGGNGGGGDLLLENATGKSATMGKKKKTKKSKIDVEAFHELNNRSTPN